MKAKQKWSFVVQASAHVVHELTTSHFTFWIVSLLSSLGTSLRSMKEEVRNLHCACMGAVEAVSQLIHFGVSFCLKARLALYDNQTLVLSLVFNATNSNNTSWFSKSRLIQSPWTEDLQNQKQNFFSLVGDLTARRAFFINKVRKCKARWPTQWLFPVAAC